MESKEDLYYLKLFAAIKWAKGFKCKKKIDGGRCGHTKVYAGKKPFSLRCKKCGHLETATAGTAFSGLRMPISTAMKILNELNYNYRKYGEAMLGYDYEDYKLAPRLPLRILSKKCKRTPKAIGVFLKRVGEWFPEYFENDSDKRGDFLKDLKSAKSRMLHARIFGLLYNDYDGKRPLKEMIYHLIFGASSKNWATYFNSVNDFFDGHGDSYDFDFYSSANSANVLRKWWESFLIKYS